MVLMTLRKDVSIVPSLRKTDRNMFAINVPEKAATNMNHQKYCNALNSAFATDVAFDPKLAMDLNITGQEAKNAVQINACIQLLRTPASPSTRAFAHSKSSGMIASRFSGEISVDASVSGIL